MRKQISISLIAVAATISIAVADYPRQFDWRQRQFVVSSVKTQADGYKGSQAFAITSALEAQYGLKYNQPVSLSPQYIIDCVPSQNKSFPILEAIADGGGIALSQYYPYTGSTNSQCYFNLTIPAIQIYGLGFQFVSGEANLNQAIFDNGPVIASFNVASDFLTYKDGIY